MPLNNLKTTTIIGGETIDGDGISAKFYGQNQQRQGKKPVSPNAGKPLFHNGVDEPEYEMPEDMAKALNEDLATKGFDAPKRKTRAKKTTSTKTDSK